jgi:hypothetical protein
VIGISDIGMLKTDDKERFAHPLEDVIEPEIGCKFGALIGVDDCGGQVRGNIRHRQSMEKKPAWNRLPGI